MKKTLLLFTSVVLLGSNVVCAQSSDSEFKLEAKPVVTVFANYHAGLGSNNELSGFELNRAYFGYQFKITPELSGTAIVDAAVSPSEKVGVKQTREVYAKNVFLTWKNYGFTVNGGLIKTLQFGVQESFWGYRYVASSFQDMYKMGSSADLGLSAAYDFTPWLSADVSFINGEGYKEVNTDNRYRYGAGITLKPVDGLVIRAYGDIYQKAEQDDDQQTLALFAGYKNRYFSLGAEYNYQKNYGFTKDDSFSGVSVYTTVPVANKWKVYGRFDYIDSSDADDKKWSINTGNHVIVGVEYHPIRQLKISPSYRYVRSYQKASDDYDNASSIYCNVGFFW